MRTGLRNWSSASWWSRWCCSRTRPTSRTMDRRERRFWWCRSRVIPISSSLTQDRYGHDRPLGTCRDRSVVSPRTACTSSSRTRRDCRRATTWSRLDLLPCVTTYRVCDQRLSGSKPIWVLCYFGHLRTAASKLKSVAGPSHPASSCRSDDVTTRRRRSRRRRLAAAKTARPQTHGCKTCTIRTPPRRRALRAHPQRHPRRRARHVSRAENPRRLGRGGPSAGSTQAGRQHRRVGRGATALAAGRRTAACSDSGSLAARSAAESARDPQPRHHVQPSPPSNDRMFGFADKVSGSFSHTSGLFVRRHQSRRRRTPGGRTIMTAPSSLQRSGIDSRASALPESARPDLAGSGLFLASHFARSRAPRSRGPDDRSFTIPPRRVARSHWRHSDHRDQAADVAGGAQKRRSSSHKTYSAPSSSCSLCRQRAAAPGSPTSACATCAPDPDGRPDTKRRRARISRPVVHRGGPMRLSERRTDRAGLPARCLTTRPSVRLVPSAAGLDLYAHDIDILSDTLDRV